jgi:predicted RNA-binding Zn-ribbon protein involved in translation (DUF1610 family)
MNCPHCGELVTDLSRGISPLTGLNAVIPTLVDGEVVLKQIPDSEETVQREDTEVWLECPHCEEELSTEWLAEQLGVDVDAIDLDRLT